MRALLLFAAFLVGAEPIRLDAPDTTHGFVTVTIPDGPPPAKGYPLCFWYHGTGGNPNTGPLLWPGHPPMIAVGMAYAIKNDTIEGRARNNWAQCTAVISRVSKRVKIDRSRVFVGGFSRGGWMASSMADRRPAGLRGAIIGGAGKSGELVGRGGKVKSPLAVLVLVGEIDENFSASQEALRYFRGIGADVYYEEFRRLGHSLRQTPRIRNFLQVHLGNPNAAEFATRIANAATIEDSWQRYLTCSELDGDAMFAKVADSAREQLLDTLRDTSRTPAVRKNLAVRKTFQAILRDEVTVIAKLRGFGPQMRDLFTRYTAVANSAGGPIAESARVAAERIRRMWAYQQSVNPAYGNPIHDKVIQSYNALGRRAAANGYRLPEADAKRLMELEARISEMKRNPQATPGPPLMLPAGARAHDATVRPLLNQQGLLPLGGLGR